METSPWLHLYVSQRLLGPLQVPSEHLEKIWADYERFEKSSGGPNNLAAQRFIEDAKPRYYAARDAWANRRRLLAAIERDALPWIPGESPSHGRFTSQRNAWVALIEFELANAQGLDATAHRKRVNLVFQQALQPLRGCPEVSIALRSLIGNIC
jgi:hypothetical protein